MSLKLRIDLLVGLSLFLGLAADIGRMVVAAGFLGLAGMKERVRGRVNFGSGARDGGLLEAIFPAD